MLQKMGWKEGQGIGRRSNTNSNALRALRRQEGLGLGAKIQSEGGSSDRSNQFAAVLQNLQVHHDLPSTDKKASKKVSKKKSNSKKLSLAKNRVTAGHARKMREAKLSAKSAEDLACIFGNKDLGNEGGWNIVPVHEPETTVANDCTIASSKADLKGKKDLEKSKKKKKKRKT